MPTIPLSLFKAYDIRGETKLLTPELAYWVGLACGTLAMQQGGQPIAVAYDGRISSPALAQALMSGLSAAGMQVLDLGLSCTPLLYFAAKLHAAGNGIMITGSHNPPEYNGIKIMLAGDTIDGAALQALALMICTEQVQTMAGGTVSAIDVAAEYYAELQRRFTWATRLKIVVDCGNGSPGAFAPSLYRALGCEVGELYCEVDGLFPNHHPDPQVAANLGDLQLAVQAQQADVGLAFDGDGDRLGVVTRSGQIIAGDRLLMLFAAAELAQGAGHVLYDVKSSRAVALWVAQQGGTSEVIPTGHSHMKRRLRERAALLAGELSGHFAFGGWGVDDALFAGAKLLQMIANGVELDRMLAQLPTSLVTPEIQIPLPEAGHALVERIAQNAEFPSARAVLAVDGLRIEYADGFGLIRASNTTPVLTLRLEADTPSALQRIGRELAAAIAPLTLPPAFLEEAL
mgnify:CR=1 FL=1